MNRDTDISPPRRRRRVRHDSPPNRNNNKDISPPRRRKRSVRHDSPPNRNNNKDISPPRRRKVSHDSLQHQKQVRQRGSLPQGRGEETVYRDRHGRRLSSLEAFMNTEKGLPTLETDQMVYGVGRVQKEERDAKIRALEAEKDKPFARRADDPELDAMFKSRTRWGDPMAGMSTSTTRIKGHHSKTGNKSKKKRKRVTKVCKFRAPPNRFNIPPGSHWDGVNRSNGFENKCFTQMNASKARANAAYRWSVEDM